MKSGEPEAYPIWFEGAIQFDLPSFEDDEPPSRIVHKGV